MCKGTGRAESCQNITNIKGCQLPHSGNSQLMKNINQFVALLLGGRPRTTCERDQMAY